MSLCYFLLSFSKGLWIVVFPFIFIVAVRFDNIVVSHRVSSHSFVKNGRFIIVVSKCSCLFFFLLFIVILFFILFLILCVMSYLVVVFLMSFRFVICMLSSSCSQASKVSSTPIALVTLHVYNSYSPISFLCIN